LNQADNTTRYLFFLVTNRHVAEIPSEHIRFNHPANRTTTVSWNATRITDWCFHPNGLDVAVAVIDDQSPVLEGRSFERVEFFLADVSTTLVGGVQPTEGDGIFVIGFPLDLADVTLTMAPVVRHGVIARIQDYRQRVSDTFLIDAPAFPGNSGSPVVLRPEVTAVGDTQSNSMSLLAGLVSTRIRSRETAISERTGEPRVVFVEDTGLAVVVPVEAVQDTVVHAVSQILPSGVRKR